MTDLSPAEHLLAAGQKLHRRAIRITEVVDAVTCKYDKDLVPFALQVSGWPSQWRVHHTAPEGMVRVVYGGHDARALDFPIFLLTASDRDAATWAREKIAAYREEALARIEMHLQGSAAHFRATAEEDVRRVENSVAAAEDYERRLAEHRAKHGTRA